MSQSVSTDPLGLILNQLDPEEMKEMSSDISIIDGKRQLSSPLDQPLQKIPRGDSYANTHVAPSNSSPSHILTSHDHVHNSDNNKSLSVNQTKFVIFHGFTSSYRDDNKLQKAFKELGKSVKIVSIKKLRDNKIGVELVNNSEYQKLKANDYGFLDLFKHNLLLKISEPAPEGFKRSRTPLFPVVIKNVNMTNEDMTANLNEKGIECKFVKQLENRRANIDTPHKLAYLTQTSDRENIINFGLHLDAFHYVCELPNFLKYTKQCFKCWGFGHTQDSCENTLNCVRCGGNHHKKDCTNEFTDTCCKNCGGEHVASNLNCPSRLQYINENPRLYVPRKKNPVKSKTKKQADTQTTPTINTTPKHMSWSDIMEHGQQVQNNRPLYVDVLKGNTQTNVNVQYPSSTPANSGRQANASQPQVSTCTPQIPQSNIAHYERISASPINSTQQYRYINKDTKLISLNVFFILVENVLSYLIHRPGPPILEEITPFLHGIIKEFIGVDSEAVMNQINSSEYY